MKIRFISKISNESRKCVARTWFVKIFNRVYIEITIEIMVYNVQFVTQEYIEFMPC